MWRDFKAFLLKQNVLALALGVVVGAATNDLVKAIVDDFIMPVVAVVAPGDRWQAVVVQAGPVAFRVGHFLSVLLQFVIVGIVAWQITKLFIRPAASAKAATRQCPYCKQSVDATATRCAFCTSEIVPAA